jgi:hypothetical protein
VTNITALNLEESAVFMPPLGHKVEQGKPPHYWHNQAQEMKVKRAELIIGKAYYMNSTANWRDDHYSLSQSYAKTGEGLKRYKVTVVETQLKTDYDKSFRNRDVLIQNSNGDQKWVALNHLRCEWIQAVKLLTDDRRMRKGYDDPANRYSRHLARKFEREQLRPAIKNLCEEIERVTGEHVWSGDKIENLELKTIKTLIQALSVIKTELTAVAS